MIEIALHNYLLDQTSITDIVGTNVWNQFAPQGTTLPCICWQVSDKLHYDHSDGAVGWCDSTFDIESWSNDIAVTLTLADAVRTSLHGFQGNMGGFRVGYITYEQEYPLTQLPQNGSDNAYYYKSVGSFKIGHDLSIPTF